MSKLNPRELLDKLVERLKQLKRYAPLLFCLFLAAIYGFVIYRVQVLNAGEPSAADVAAQSRTSSVPHIDPAVLKQLQQLQDNSVSVQTLFNSSRDNPFQE
jgi:hypothetical protein